MKGEKKGVGVGGGGDRGKKGTRDFKYPLLVVFK